jgi:hypothetical protein
MRVAAPGCKTPRMLPRRRTLALAYAALSVALVSTAAPAHAGPPGKWTTISGAGVSTIVEPGLYRTADGTLHVAIAGTTNNTNSIEVAHVNAAGTLTGRSPAVTGWAGTTEDPDLVGAPGGGMRLVFGGLRTTVTGDPYNEGYVYSASSDATGAAWTLAPNTSPAIASTSGYGSYGTGVTTLADGTVVAAYPLNSTITYQVGANAPQAFNVDACCAYDISLANDNGTVWAAWYGNGATPTTEGTFVRTIYPALGPIIKAPDSATGNSALGTDQAVAMVARAGGGVYLAYLKGYPSTKSVALWRVGDPKAKLVKHSKDAGHVALSNGSGGRLWLAFDDRSDDIHAVHTNPAATQFGADQLVRTPKGSTVYEVGVEGSTGRADIVFNNGTAILHTQALYGLSVKASPHSIKAGKAGHVTFTVTDAGDPVKGAKVKAKGESCKTDKHGKCTITFPGLPAHPFDVRATARSYADGSVTIKVKK